MITIQDSKSYVITEEQVDTSTVLSEISVSEPALFDITEGNKEDYLKIDATTGTVTLTSSGVIAVNSDYPDDPSKEIQEFRYIVQATSIEDNSKSSVEVVVGVIRVHDEPPFIADEIITPLYSEDVSTGMRVVEIRTAYAAKFTVIDNVDKLTVKDPIDVGRIILTSTGANWISSILTEDPDATLDFEVLIEDLENELQITQKYSLNILPGSAQAKVPTKTVLDLTGEILGSDAGGMQSENKFNLFKIKLDTDYYFSEIENHILELLKTRKIDELNKEEFNELFDLINYKINYIAGALKTSLKSIQDEYTDGLYKAGTELKELTDEIELVEKDLIQRLNAHLTHNNILIESTKISLLNYIHHEDDRVLTQSQAENDALESKLTQLITDLRNEFETFRDVTFEVYKETINDRLDDINERIDDNDKDISNINDTLEDHEKRITEAEAAVEDAAARTLEDFDNDDGWDFTDFDLMYQQNKIISISGTTTYFGTTGTTNIHVDADSFGNSELDCEGKEFTGTASSAKYADLAEFYTIDTKNFIPGLIVNFSASHKETEIELADGYKEPIGIISTAPGFKLNQPPEDSEFNWAPIALTGRVPVYVTNADNAERGDYVYQSDIVPRYGVVVKVKDPNKKLLGVVIQQLSDGKVEVKV